MLESHYFFLLKLHPSLPGSCLPGAPLSAEVPRRLHSQEGGFNWGPSTRAWILGDFTLALKPRGSGHHQWVALGILVSARENQREYRIETDLNEGHPAWLSGPHTSPALEFKPNHIPGIK